MNVPLPIIIKTLFQFSAGKNESHRSTNSHIRSLLEKKGWGCWKGEVQRFACLFRGGVEKGGGMGGAHFWRRLSTCVQTTQ